MSNILLVDDSQTLRVVVRQVIEELGHQVCEAYDGVNALEILSHYRPDLIITDLNMPEMNGFELIRQIRLQDELKYIPVVMLTTESSARDKERAKELNVRAWLTKPFSAAKVQMALERLLPN